MRNTGIEYTSAERTPTILPDLAELLPPLSGEQLAALERQSALLHEDHAARSELLDRGLVRRPEVNALSRAIAEAARRQTSAHSTSSATQLSMCSACTSRRQAAAQKSQSKAQREQAAMHSQ